jgi:carboxyl-terminal processing protease
MTLRGPTPLHRFRLSLAPFVLAIVSACSSAGGGAAADGGYAGARDMFVTGYEQLEIFYIEPVNLDDLTMAGLSHLSTLDPKLKFEHGDRTITIVEDGKPVRALDVPDGNHAKPWGIFTANAVIAAEAASPTLRDKPAEDIYQAVFTGITAKLDGFSRYASAEAAEDNRASRDGFGGIGIRISLEDGKVRIVSVMHYTPAERVGLMNDDVITHIDGKPVAGLDQHAVVAMLRGPVDSQVKLTVQRGGEPTPRELGLTRALVVPETVTYRREGDVAYIRIYGFNAETASSLRREISNAQADIGKKLRGYILDLRGNPGGLLDQAIAVSDLFVDSGRIVSTHGRHPDSHQYFEATEGDVADAKPVVVLVNGGSASAAEIVAAALQDDERAVVVGSNSYGKGTVQTVVRMPNNGELTLTWARYHAPSGYTLNHLGVLPSICTSRAEDSRDVRATVTALKEDRVAAIPTLARNAASPTDIAALNKLRAACPARKEENPVDLQVALQILAEPHLYARAVHLADVPGQAAAAALPLPAASNP